MPVAVRIPMRPVLAKRFLDAVVRAASPAAVRPLAAARAVAFADVEQVARRNGFERRERGAGRRRWAR